VIRRRFLFTLLPLGVACNRRPGSGYAGFAYVATAGSPSIVGIDLQAFAVRHRIDLPAQPTDLLAHPDPATHRIYAVTPHQHALIEIDIARHLRTRTVKLGAEPVTVIAAHGELWTLLRGEPRLAPAGSAGVTLPAQPVAMDISPKAPLACVTLEDSSVVFIDLKARRTLGSVKLDDKLGAVRFRSDGKLALVAGRGRRLLNLIDVDSRRLYTQLPLALCPDHFCVSPDGGQLFITGEGRDAVVVAYPYRSEIAQTSLTGRHPGEMAVSSSPDYLFVSNPTAGSVTVFDTTSQRVVAVTGVGVEPGPVLVTPDQQFALVLNRTSGDMAVIRIAAITPGRREKTAPLFTMIPVGARPVAALIVPA
jgi:DNA-binding beta-propeller fold protein YncE